MKLMKRPKIENEARLTITIQHAELKRLLDGQITEIEVHRSDKIIIINEKDFGKLKFSPMDGGWFVANYSACL